MVLWIVEAIGPSNSFDIRPALVFLPMYFSRQAGVKLQILSISSVVVVSLVCTISALLCHINRFFPFCRGSGWESWGVVYVDGVSVSCIITVRLLHTIRRRTRCGLGISNGSFNLTGCYRPRTGADRVYAEGPDGIR